MKQPENINFSRTCCVAHFGAWIIGCLETGKGSRGFCNDVTFDEAVERFDSYAFHPVVS